jgi:5'-AMP-activated protein kinase regulatory beta subunit
MVACHEFGAVGTHGLQVFHWNHGGQQVYVTGTFNNWAAKIPMAKSHNDFTLILDIPPGQYEYRFIVDDEW